MAVDSPGSGDSANNRSLAAIKALQPSAHQFVKSIESTSARLLWRLMALTRLQTRSPVDTGMPIAARGEREQALAARSRIPHPIAKNCLRICLFAPLLFPSHSNNLAHVFASNTSTFDLTSDPNMLENSVFYYDHWCGDRVCGASESSNSSSTTFSLSDGAFSKTFSTPALISDIAGNSA